MMERVVGRHIALTGFMGSGKTTLGRRLGRVLERRFVDVDRELEARFGLSIEDVFASRGEAWFREREAELTQELLSNPVPAVLALGGGAVMADATRAALGLRAVTVYLDVAVDEAWRRVAGSDRPLARDETAFVALYEERLPVYRSSADVVANDLDPLLLGLGDVVVSRGALHDLDTLLPGEMPVALVADQRVLELHPPALGARVAQTLTVPSGEDAKRLEICQGLWDQLQLDRAGLVVALGGGTTTDVAGFVAATYLRGVNWAAVPSTLVGQVDAAIGGKTGIDLQKGKNLVGSFHTPVRVVVDPDLLSTLPESQRAEGMAEVVKTGLLAGRSIWELDDESMVTAAAAFKTAVCIADPTESGRRAILNLGHTFAHGLEAAGRYAGPTHGEAVALGLRAALRLSMKHLGLDADVLQGVEESLPVERAQVDLDAAWRAMSFDKKARGGTLRLVLLEAPGKPVFNVELPDDEVREELVRLVA